jgi:tetratricopeptide (TPR) repeat protein/energy-coupling factor transporter ATP-binding protein EcfA2
VGLFNPFPGLRPFEADEEHLFFGREKETDELLRRLRTNRFLAVVGTSGSGKSSLVRSGLIPSLQAGYLVGASSSWRMAVLRPGEDPVGNLAAALAHPDVLGITDEEFAATNRVLMEATLRRGPQGLVDAVRQARLPKDHNLLVLVDQFEELFRFRRNAHIAHSRDEAIAFVRTLLEAVRQQDLPIYVALTMRSDFIGDCMDFPGLSEAVNSGLYLVGRMSRDQLRSAITGPVAVGGGTIAPRLVHRVLNDLGDDQDQLPLVQHALMRTWEYWAGTRTEAAPIDVADYEAIGTFNGALSRHAEEAYAEAESEGLASIAMRVFQALTDTVSDPRGVRRPTSVGELAAIAGASESDVARVVDGFRRAGRSFLMPPAAVALTPRSIIDLSHESLMRCWTRLIDWAEQERRAAEFYVRLSRAARWRAEGTGGLWRNPELELAERWLKENEPNAAWASRYDEGFERARAFLADSVEARRSEELRVERERRTRLRRAQGAAAVLGVFLIVASALAYLAWRESQRAEKNLDLARAAVDQSLSSVDRNPARVGADVPQLDELRRDLLGKAQTFYTAFMREEPTSEALKRDVALAHVKIGHINRLLEKPAEAENEYKDAIVRLRGLADTDPSSALQEALADANNWLGETLRPQAARAADAEAAYNQALEIQGKLVTEQPANAQIRREFARSHYNRGILRAERGNAAASEADFREAIRLLESPGAGGGAAAQELARAYNNLGTLLADDPKRSAEVGPLWEKAIAIDEALVAADPENRECKIELATFCANIAPLLKEQGADAEADQRSRQALSLVQEQARLAPSLTVTLADTHSLRGTILEAKSDLEANREYADALDLFAGAGDQPAVRARPDYQLRFGDLLVNLAALHPTNADRRALLGRAVRAYATMAETIASSGPRAEAQAAADTIARILPSMPQANRAELTAAARQLSNRLGDPR